MIIQFRLKLDKFLLYWSYELTEKDFLLICQNNV